jgi:transposase
LTELRLTEEKLALREEEIRRLKHQVAFYQRENELRREQGLFGSNWVDHPSSQTTGGNFSPNRPGDDLSQEIKRLETIIAQLEAEKAKDHKTIETLLKANEDLRVKLSMPRPNSSNSGLSSYLDISDSSKKKAKDDETPEKPREKKRRGGKKGHAPHFRKPFSDEEVDKIECYKIDQGSLCQECGTELQRAPEADEEKCHTDMIPAKLVKIKHKILGYKCPNCGRVHKAPVPEEVKRATFLSPSILVRLLLMKNKYYLSMDKIRDYLEQTLNLKVATSYINKSLKNVSAIFRSAYLETLDNIKTQRVLNIDETVIKCAGNRMYVWAFIGSQLAAFKIASRSGDILASVLGDDYDGTIISDCYIAYISYAKKNGKVGLQLCLVHLKRDFKHCSDWITNKEVREFGEKGEKYLKEIFELHRQFKSAEDKNAPEAQKSLQSLKAIEEEFIELCVNAPTSSSKARGIAKRFKEFPQYYFVFAENPDVEPSNNVAERAIRSIVLERKISYGTQGANGNRSCEVLWTIRETARKQGVSLENYYTEAITASIAGKPIPSLVNLGKPVAQKYIEAAKKELKEQKAIDKTLARARAKQESADANAEAAPVNNKPEPPASEVKPKPEPPVLEVKPKSEPSVLEVKPKPEPSVLELNAKPEPPASEARLKPEPPVLEVKPKPEPPSSNKMRKASAEIIDKEDQKTADNTPASITPNPSSKAGKRLKRPTANHPAKTGREPHQPPPLVIAPGSLRSESGACPKGSHSYASPKPGSSLANQGGRPALKPEINPGAKGRGASRKTLKKSPSPLSQNGIR